MASMGEWEALAGRRGTHWSWKMGGLLCVPGEEGSEGATQSREGMESCQEPWAMQCIGPTELHDPLVLLTLG